MINPRAAGLPPSLTWTRVNSLTNNAIYGTHGMPLASQFHERTDAARMIHALQNPLERQGTHLAKSS